MSQIITSPTLRIKITGECNRTCNFCNEEGDMRTIESIDPDESFFECVHTLAETLQINHIMLTGGEPTIHPDLREIISGISVPDISVTTNGIQPLSVDEWGSLIAAREADLNIRVNTVAYHSQEQVQQVLYMLQGLQQRYGFGIRLLNDLTNIKKSQQIIHDICQALGAVSIMEERRAGSSNVTVLWETESGFRFSTKMAFRYFFGPICAKCSIREQCHEGFYGIRIEQRMSDYWVRLCIYKHTPDVLIPWRLFIQSDIANEFKNICEIEQPSL